MDNRSWADYRRQCIVDYVNAGYALFPCNIDKTPRRKAWQHTPHDSHLDPASVGEVYGVVLTNADLVLDVDPRRFKDGENQLTELWQNLNLPREDTFIVGTASGGCHIYFKKPPEVAVRRVVPGYPAIEVKSKGQYVIGAGSRLSPDRRYRNERGTIQRVIALSALARLSDTCGKNYIASSGFRE